MFPVEVVHINKQGQESQGAFVVVVVLFVFALDPSSFHLLNKCLFNTYLVSGTVTSVKIL